MTTGVLRNKAAEADPSHWFHRMQCSIPWPEGAISATRACHGAPWIFYTVADRHRDRVARMLQRVKDKRECAVSRRFLRAYVWVFYVSGFYYGGWWTYLIGKGIDCGKYWGKNRETIQRLMKVFPLVNLELFDIAYEKWQVEFAKAYRRGTRGGKAQGYSPVWVELDDSGGIKGILGRVQWLSEEAVA